MAKLTISDIIQEYRIEGLVSDKLYSFVKPKASSKSVKQISKPKKPTRKKKKGE